MEAQQPTVEFSTAATLYRHTWSKTAYTSFLLLQKLLELTETPLRTYIQDPESLKANKATTNAAIKAARCGELEDLWQTATGTCTIWAVNLARQLTGSPSGLILGDLGNHRAAWSENGVVIDSSVLRAIDLSANEQYCSEKKGSWRIERGTGGAKLLFKVCSSNIWIGISNHVPGCQSDDREGIRATFWRRRGCKKVPGSVRDKDHLGSLV